MSDLLKALAEIKDKVGVYSFVLIIIACILGGFAKQFGDFPIKEISNPIAMIAVTMLLAGVVVGLVNLFASIFVTRPARGLIDGLLSGILASLFGGLFGFGFHINDHSYVDPFYIRMFYCAIFTIPVSAVLGLIFDLFQADRNLNWSNYFAVLCTAIIISVSMSIAAVMYFMPTMKGNGISVSDIQLLFESFILFSIIVAFIQFKWKFMELMKAMVIFLTGVLMLRLFSHYYPLYETVDAWNWSCDRVECFTMFQDDYAQTVLAITLATLTLWSISTYGVIARANSGAIRRNKCQQERNYDV